MDNSELVLGKHEDELPESAAALDFLHRLWPSPSDESRALWWRFRFPIPGIRVGDIGVFEMSAGKGYGFRKLCNVAEELGMEVEGPRCRFEQTAPLEFRQGFFFLSNPAWLTVACAGTRVL